MKVTFHYKLNWSPENSKNKINHYHHGMIFIRCSNNELMCELIVHKITSTNKNKKKRRIIFMLYCILIRKFSYQVHTLSEIDKTSRNFSMSYKYVA